MANARDIEMKLPSLDELFSSQEERDDAKLKRIYDIPLDEIDPFPNHPFKVRDDEDMLNLVESVRVNGVLTPATVRKKEDGRYELLSGHRRFRACELAGIDTLRCEVVDMNRDEGTIFMVESNFQRTRVLPSEKAFAYKMRLEAMNRQGRRQSLTSGHVVQKFSRDEIGDAIGESGRTISRYIRLTELIPEILEKVDEGQMAMRPALEISFIPRVQQGYIWQCMDAEQCSPSHAQAIRMRQMAAERKLTPEAIEAIMLEEKPNQKERIVLRGERFNRLFPPDLPVSKREDYVATAMEYYARHRQRQRERDDNNCYSLEGAQYTAYDKNGSAAGTLTLNANGESNTIDLMEGTYTVKETYAPPGYAKDPETYTVKIVSEETTTFTAKDEPITDLVELLLTKNPVGYPHDHGEGDATLKGAVYKFS